MELEENKKKKIVSITSDYIFLLTHAQEKRCY